MAARSPSSTAAERCPGARRCRWRDLRASAACVLASAPSGSAFTAEYSGDDSYAASSGGLPAATAAAVAVRAPARKRSRPRVNRRHAHRRRPGLATPDHDQAARLALTEGGAAACVRSGDGQGATIDDLLAAARERLTRLDPGGADAAVREGATLIDIRSDAQIARRRDDAGRAAHPAQRPRVAVWIRAVTTATRRRPTSRIT